MVQTCTIRRWCELEQRASRGCNGSSSLCARVGHQRGHLSSGDPSLVSRSGVSSAMTMVLWPVPSVQGNGECPV
jgi:hypothetical protein